MRFGIFAEFECPPGTSEATAFGAAMVQMVAARAHQHGRHILPERVLRSMRLFAERVAPRPGSARP